MVAEGNAASIKEKLGFRSEPNRLIVVGDGTVVVTLLFISVGAPSNVTRVLGIDPNRLVVVRDGAVEFAFVLV